MRNLINNARRVLRTNKPGIMAGLGVGGTVITAYLAARGGMKAARLLDEAPEDLPNKEKAQLIWTCFLPAAGAGVGTIACIVGSNNVHGKRTAAAVSAYSITEKMFGDYRQKVKEEIGAHREQVLRDDLARDHVEKNPPKNGEILIAGPGNVLCCEKYTGRYFLSDIETLRKAQNDINAQIVQDLYVSLDEFYHLIGLRPTCTSGELGWDSDRLMELEISTVLAEDGRPCLAFQYNYVKPI